MKKNNGNINLVKSESGWRRFMLTVIAAIPVFFIAYFYTDSLMERDDEKAAMLITIYFIACIYAGRYLSYLWVNKEGTVSKNIFTVNGIVIIVSAALVFILAQATLSFNQFFLRI